MDLFSLLSFDERVIVLSHAESRQIYTWNRSLTLQVWQEIAPGKWEEIDVRTLAAEPTSVEMARKAAQRWLLGT